MWEEPMRDFPRRAGWNSVKYGSTWMARSAAETIWTVKSVRAVGMIRIVKSGNAVEVTWIVKNTSAAELAGIGEAHARMHCRMLCFKVPCAAVRRARISYFRVSPR